MKITVNNTVYNSNKPFYIPYAYTQEVAAANPPASTTTPKQPRHPYTKQKKSYSAVQLVQQRKNISSPQPC